MATCAKRHGPGALLVVVAGFLTDHVAVSAAESVSSAAAGIGDFARPPRAVDLLKAIEVAAKKWLAPTGDGGR